MKKVMEIVTAIKGMASLVFTGLAFIGLAVWSIRGEAVVGVSLVWQLMAISVIAAVLQFVVFSTALLKKAPLALRYILFIIPMYAVISGFALGFGWFPVYGKSWLIFSAIFVVIFLGMLAGFEIYFYISGSRYTKGLADYRDKGLGAEK